MLHPRFRENRLVEQPETPTDAFAVMEHRLAWLTRWLGIGVLALVGVTWKLWTPQDVFPRVPLFRWAPPDWWDWLSFGLIAVSGLGLGVGPSRFTRSFTATLAAGLAIAFLCDQHRLQPWAWQFFILSLLVTLADKPLQWHGWQWLTISIYFYSALSKFDDHFYFYASGQLEHFAGARLFPQGIPSWYLAYRSIWVWVARLCPVGELAIAGLLVFRRGKNLGVIMAVLMHMVLITILGPYGLRHSQGVLLWNLWFMVQTLGSFAGNWLESVLKPSMVLQLSPMSASQRKWERLSREISQFIARAILVFVLAWPATRPWGLCDFWIGWAVYVPLNEQIDVQINKDAVHEKSPRFSLPVWWTIPDEFAFYHPDIGEWSLIELRVPEYPHRRCRLAAVLDLAIRKELKDISVNITPSRGRYKTPWSLNLSLHLNGVDEINHYCRRFWFNAYPTSMYRRAARDKMMSDDG